MQVAESNEDVTILVVDDNEAKRYIAARTLALGNYKIFQASTGKEAIRLAQQALPDLMVVDIKLPDIDGFEVCKIIKSNAGTSFIPVLHYSATLNTPEARIYGLQEGADAFLTQDARPEELLATVKALLRMRQAEMSLRKRNERLEIISKAAEHLLASDDLNTLMSDLFTKVAPHLNIDTYFNFMLNGEPDTMVLASCAGVTEEQMPPGITIKFGQAICGNVAKYKKPIYATDIQNSDEEMVQLVKGFGLRAYSCNPLMANNRLLGTLSFATRNRDAFSPDEIEFMRLLTHYVALAVERFETLHEARTANKRKDEFIANMSHEMRTPMNVILGLGDVLLNTSPLTEKQKLCLNTLHGSATSLLDLINDLLDIAKIESKNVELEFAPFSLKELSEEISHMMRVRADQKNIKLKTEYDKSLAASYRGDAFRLRQIIINLLSNAIKFTEKGSVRLRFGRTSMPDGADAVQISVSDTGIGIQPQKMDAIFNKFAQANVSTTRIYGGTGLGLTITKAFVELMKGNIEVKSVLGEGTTFVVTLPLPAGGEIRRKRTAASSNISPASVGKDDGEPPLVLLVEDHAANQLVAGEILNGLGYRYEIAETGKEAVEKVKDKDFNIILMDIQMPEMDGLEATRLIRQYEKIKEIVTPIIGITAYATSNDKDKCLEAGMDDYISKPFNHDELVNKLSRAMAAKKEA